MASLEMWVIVASLAVATMIQIYATFKIVQISTSAVVSSVQALDGAIAEAITSVVEQGIGNIEPPNPLVAILADVMKQNLNRGTAEVTVLDRSQDGKFISKQE